MPRREVELAVAAGRERVERVDGTRPIDVLQPTVLSVLVGDPRVDHRDDDVTVRLSGVLEVMDTSRLGPAPRLGDRAERRHVVHADVVAAQAQQRGDSRELRRVDVASGQPHDAIVEALDRDALELVRREELLDAGVVEGGTPGQQLAPHDEQRLAITHEQIELRRVLLGRRGVASARRAAPRGTRRPAAASTGRRPDGRPCAGPWRAAQPSAGRGSRRRTANRSSESSPSLRPFVARCAANLYEGTARTGAHRWTSSRVSSSSSERP